MIVRCREVAEIWWIHIRLIVLEYRRAPEESGNLIECRSTNKANVLKAKNYSIILLIVLYLGSRL